MNLSLRSTRVTTSESDASASARCAGLADGSRPAALLDAPARGFRAEVAALKAQSEVMTSACLNPLCPWRLFGRGAAQPQQAAGTEACLNPLCPRGISAEGARPEPLRIV